MGATLPMLTFATPYWLAAVLPVLMAAWFAVRRGHLRHDPLPTPAVVLVHPDLSALPATQSPKGSARLQWWLEVAALILLLLALAQPQWIGDWISSEPEGREIMLLVDGSKSMSISDFESNGQPVERLSVLKGLVSQFVNARAGDRFGLVVFGDHAYTLTPPTFDRTLVTRMLQRIPVGIAGEDTAIGEALGLALKQLQDHPKGSRRPALILFTDGDSTAGVVSPREALEVAVRMQVPVYTVEIGTDLFGHAALAETKPEQERDPNPDLKEIARASGGNYYQATSADALKRVIADIGALEKTIIPPSTRRERREWFLLPLLLAVMLLTASRWLQIREQLT